MVDRIIPIPPIHEQQPPASDPDSLKAALAETSGLISHSRKPVILAGVELHRHHLTDQAIRLAEKLNIPIAGDLLSKSAVPENHPLYLGVYGGAMSSEEFVRHYVESSDCVLMLGTFITDMNMGIYTARLDRNRTILATTESLAVRYHKYDEVQFADFLNGLLAAKLRKKNFKHPAPQSEPKPLAEPS